TNQLNATGCMHPFAQTAFLSSSSSLLPNILSESLCYHCSLVVAALKRARFTHRHIARRLMPEFCSFSIYRNTLLTLKAHQSGKRPLPPESSQPSSQPARLSFGIST